MTTALILLLLLGTLGAADTLYYHEWRQRLPRRATATVELRLHATRDFAYALLFAGLAWFEFHGAWAWLLAGVLAFEIVITLWDFIEEDIHRPLPAGERVMHTLIAIVYGAFLAYLVPSLYATAERSTALLPTHHGLLSYLLTLFALGVLLSGFRDAIASLRCRPALVPGSHAPQAAQHRSRQP